MVKKKQTPLTDEEVEQRVGQWRDLAEQFIVHEGVYFTYSKTIPLIEQSKGKTDSKLQPDEDPSDARKRLAYGVAYYLRNDTATNSDELRKELKLWEKVGKAVISLLDQHPPMYCDDGKAALMTAKQLLEMKLKTKITLGANTGKPTVINLPLGMMYNNDQLRVAITDTEGNILVPDLVIDDFSEEIVK